MVIALAATVAAPRLARGALPCMGNDNLCEPDKLCTFRASMAEKEFIQSIFQANAPSAKRPKGGLLYQAAVAEARTDLPNGTAAQRAAQAGANFQAKVKDHALKNFKVPACKDGAVDLTLLPKPGYDGMETTPACQVFATFNAGQYDAASFGSSDATSCPEFYDRDRAHEEIHRRACVADKTGARLGIDRLIQEEIVAYDHSVRLTRAYVRLLSLRCSPKATPAERRRRAKELQDLLAPYQAKGH
jgi:hypothetical protein